MPRKVELTVPAESTKEVVDALNQLEGLINLQVYKSASANEPGDVVKATVATKALQQLMRQMDSLGLGKKPGFSLATSEPDSLISPGFSNLVDRDGTLASWEEMEMIISKDSNANSLILLLLIASGILAATGIATNAIHVVIGAMLVAPGFMPIMRIPLGIVSGCKAVWIRGITDVFLAYGVLIAAAALTAFFLQATGTEPLPGKADYYELTNPLLKYWTTLTSTSVVASAAAGLAGAIMIATKRSIFTSGVMIGLALVPSASLIGMALVTGDVASAGQAAIRWLVDVLLVLASSFIVFSILKAIRYKRNMAM
ncbi:DUF389 domain-containing protein [Pontibacter sp. SGAir0037]|uniref:DUF389 domain-containing protein n=1 Tax=Pontibacter sp. SGAir0037 TaxID=2571030 RepID=UPI0010CCC078|nr:DUF389 domain-containing protein [Pontibacter sp. SGAir0037]QCR21377.1 hypothetical protein C1N53_02780 [Pontibacter sp. SGAir0037]